MPATIVHAVLLAMPAMGAAYNTGYITSRSWRKAAYVLAMELAMAGRRDACIARR
jgi:hypothetical protein